MNVLFIADPNSIHDMRWIDCLIGNNGINGYGMFRAAHRDNVPNSKSKVIFLRSIEDPSIVRPWRNWLQLRRIRKIVKTYRIDLLHVFYAEPNALWAVWRSYLNVPIIITTRGTDILKTIPQFFESRLLLHKIVARRYRQAFTRADHICCTSHKQILNVTRYQFTTPVSLIRTGVDPEVIATSTENIEERYGILNRFVLMPRSMKPLYNHEFTIDAIELLDPHFKKEYTFVFVNCDTQDQVYFKSICKKAEKVAADIRFLPTLSHRDFLSICRKASLVIMNPLSDGSPVSAMEAMACRVPVILPPLEYDMEIFKSVWFFQEWKVAALKKVIEEVFCLGSYDLNARLDENFRNVLQAGNTQSEMEKMMDIYTALID